MADMTNPEDHIEELIHIAPKRRDSSAPGITTELMMAMETKLNEALRLAGDTAPRLMYEIADVVPSSLDAFTRHHAEHFNRRTVYGGDQVEVAAVLIRHAFIVGALATQAVHRAGRA